MLSLYDNIIIEGEIVKNVLGIKKAAKERGVTLAIIARKLHMHRSNMSAIASGARGVSLDILKKISRILDSSLDELIFTGNSPSIFRDRNTQNMLDVIERKNHDGADKTWVNRVIIAHHRHYKHAKRVSE